MDQLAGISSGKYQLKATGFTLIRSGPLLFRALRIAAASFAARTSCAPALSGARSMRRWIGRGRFFGRRSLAYQDPRDRASRQVTAAATSETNSSSASWGPSTVISVTAGGNRAAARSLELARWRNRRDLPAPAPAVRALSSPPPR